MITAAVAHFEQRQRTAKMKRGQRAAAERGMWLGGPPPFGYRADREGRGTVLRVDPEERVVVERAVHLVVDLGLSTWEAARRLNLEGLGPRRADRWRHQNLRRTLSSDALRGHVVWGRGKQQPYVLPVEPVLPARRFQALQAALAASALPRRRDGHLYPLTGFMQGACGARYYGTYRADRGGGIRQYRCHGNHAYADSRCGDRWRPHADALETAVWEEIGRVLTHENLVRLADAWLAREQLRQQPLIEQLQEEVLRLEVVVASTAVDLVRAGMDPTAAARAVGHLNEDLLSKRRRLDGAQGTRTDAPGDDLRAEAARPSGRRQTRDTLLRGSEASARPSRCRVAGRAGGRASTARTCATARRPPSHAAAFMGASSP